MSDQVMASIRPEDGPRHTDTTNPMHVEILYKSTSLPVGCEVNAWVHVSLLKLVP